MPRGDRDPADATHVTPHDSPSVPEAPLPGAVVPVGGALWWYSSTGHWRVVHEDLWRCDGNAIVWRPPDEPLPCRPVTWDIVFAPLRATGAVVAVRVIRVSSSDGDVVVRGVTPAGDEIEVRRNAREYFADPVEAGLEIAIPPRLDAVVEFPEG